MKKLIAIALCFVFAALVFSGCRGSVRDQDVVDRNTEPTTGMTTPSMPSEPTVPSMPTLPSEPTVEHTEPTDGYSEPTQKGGMGNGDTMDGAMSRSQG